MVKKIHFLLIFICLKLSSQVSFSDGKTILDKTHYSSHITTLCSSDLNNDGYKELIVGSDYDNTIMFYKNINGDIQENQRIILYKVPNLSGYSIADIKSIDIDNDGLNDIVVASKFENKIYWFKNFGNFNFSELKLIAENIYTPLTLEVGDIDNDGDNDIIAGMYSDENICLFKNDGSGNFTSKKIIYNTSYGINKIKLFDIDNNGYLDIISGQEDGTINWARNLDGTEFGASQYITGSADDGTGFDFIDVNSDGYSDIIFSSNYDDKIRVAINQQGLNFSTSSTIIDNNIIDPYQITSIDMDNDGKKDIVVSTTGTNSFIGWYKNNNGSFSALKKIITNISNPKVFIVDDLDKDDNMEIITSSYGSGFSKWKLSKYEYNALTNIFDETIINFNLDNLVNIKFADIDNDGKKDIISAMNNTIIWNKNLGDNNFSSQKNIIGLFDDNGVFDFEIGDFNNDGYVDVIWVTSKKMELFKNNGNETFTLVYTLPLSPIYTSTSVKVFDLNNDGKLDILLSYIEGSYSRIYKIFQNQNFDFQSPQKINTDFLSSIKIGDIDNDGNLDIIGSYPFNSFLWLKNDGLGNFTTQPTIPTPNDTGLILELGDIDNDGDLDIICGSNYSYSAGNLYIIKNNSLNFNTNIFLDKQSCKSIALADIDNDGDLDLLGTSYQSYTPYDEKIFYYLNNGASFSNQKIVESLGNSRNYRKELIIADINSDNKLDIISSYFGESTIKIFTNNSTLLNIDDSNISSTLKFIIYPNPSAQKINWDNSYKIKSISVFDTSGKEVLQKHFNSNFLNIENLTKGIYFINAMSENNKVYKSRFIKN